MTYASKKVPAELRRLAVTGIVAGVVATALIYSRGEHIAPEDIRLGSKLAFQQPKGRQQADGWFTPTQANPSTQRDSNAILRPST
jgi:hypothetical protein